VPAGVLLRLKFASESSGELVPFEALKGRQIEVTFAKRIGIRHFGVSEDKELGSFAPEFPKSQNATQLWRRKRPNISKNWHFRF
jgi:hypothetical protein